MGSPDHPAKEGEQGEEQRKEEKGGTPGEMESKQPSKGDDHDEGGDREDDSSGEGFASRGGGLYLVGFENGSVAKQAAKNEHSDDGRGNGSGYGHSSFESEVNVGGAHDHRQDQPQ